MKFNARKNGHSWLFFDHRFTRDGQHYIVLTERLLAYRNGGATGGFPDRGKRICIFADNIDWLIANLEHARKVDEPPKEEK